MRIFDTDEVGWYEMQNMKAISVMFLVIGLAGCGKSPSTGDSNGVDAQPGQEEAALSKADAERTLKSALHADELDQLIEVALIATNLRDREGLAHNLNQPEPYNGLIKGMTELDQLNFLGWVTAGQANGFTTNWYGNGRKKSEGFLLEGKKDGRWTYWDEQGNKSLADTWKKGKQEGLVVKWFKNGQKMSEGPVKDGQFHGIAILWFESGQKRLEASFKAGTQDGPAIMWHENGEKMTDGAYKDGKLEGAATMWHDNGQKKVEGVYKEGKPVFRKFWNRSGVEVATEAEADR